MLTRQRGYITLLLYAGAALAVVALLYGAYKWVDTSWETTAGIERGTKTKQAEWDAAVAEQRKREQEAGQKAEVKLGDANVKAKVIYRTLTKNVDRVVTRELYRNVCLDPDGMSNANAALVGALPIADKPNAGVPKPDAPR